jgi:trans-2,3-dihydro-3-hydroxyanthranilate isomerase
VARHRFTLLDVFTSQPLTGNGLAVVHDADGLDEPTMRAFAREMRLSETSFIQSPGEGGDYRHRIFMPTGEIPFAGHPSLGAAVAVARARGEREATYVQETHAGRQPIDVVLDGDRARASMLQEPPRFGDQPDAERVLGAVGLEGDDADPALPPQFVSTGVWQLMACVRDRAALGRLLPDFGAIAAHLRAGEALVLYVAHVDPSTGEVAARSFAGSREVGEDPATGSAAGPLCALVAERTGCSRLEIVQGVEMGRRSVLRAELEDGRVRVGGDVVAVVDGHVTLDI